MGQGMDALQDAQELIRLREALDFLWGVLPSDEVVALPDDIRETCRKNHLVYAHPTDITQHHQER